MQIRVTAEGIAEATKESGSNMTLIVAATLTVSVVLGVVGWMILADSHVPEVSVTERADSIEADITHEPQAKVSEVVESEPPKPNLIEAEPVETKIPGLGLTLNQFKHDVPIGEAWKVLSDTPRDDGSISYQLISTVMENVMLSVSGNPEDLREVSVVFFAKTNQSDAENVTRIAVMTFFLSKYSNWTKDELNDFWIRLMQVGAGDETEFKIQKNTHRFWLTPRESRRALCL